MKHLLAAEGQELTNQIGGGGRGSLDHSDFLSDGIARGKRFVDNVRTSDNHREEIIEIMRNAAGKLTDRFHALREPELAFDLFSFADIDDCAGNG